VSDGANRLEARLAALRESGARGVAPYVTAGDGGLETTLCVLRALDGAGALCVELGVPFSDPIADGPVLQAAAQRALAAGATLDGVLDVVRELRAGGSELPLAIFSYANPLLRRGWEGAARAIAGAGGDALLVPDLPAEEGGGMRAAALEHGLCPIFFVAPTSSGARVRAAAAMSRGFLYAIGRVGTTGAETRLDDDALAFLRRVRAACELPLAVGFGLRTAEQIAAVTAEAELAIVGSALVERVHAAFSHAHDPGQAAAAAAEYLSELRRGTQP